MEKKIDPNTIHTLTLDICYEDALDLLCTLAAFAREGVECKVLHASAPGGGWPEIEIKGTKTAIMAAIPLYFWTPTNRSVDTFEFHAGLEG